MTTVMAARPVTRHVLPGLRPQPLASYLAGLGLFRVLAEQADPEAAAAWSPQGLVISTTVADLAGWLADSYVPAPVVSPWNGGSGFGPKDKEPKRALDAITAHPSGRLAVLKDAIRIAREAHARSLAAGWISAEGKVTDKARVVQELRNRCSDELLPWIDASVVLAGPTPGRDEQAAYFPPLLGTGGNDGRLDFSSNFHQRLLEVLDPAPKGRERSVILARDLLAGTETEKLAQAAIGQFDPASAGGPGSSRFGAADSLVSPWAYILLVEGAMLFASSTVRRHQHDVHRAAMPFTVTASPDGSASGADGEQSTSRGEIWAPVWTSDFTLPEARQLFTEARASWRGRPARQAVDFYAATRTLGVARGIGSFVRYGLHQRNGRAFIAVPVDVVEVRSRPEVRLAGQLDDWVSRARGAESSGAITTRAVRGFDAAYLAFARDGEPLQLARLLSALTRLEQAVGQSGRAREKIPVRHQLPPAGDFLSFLAQAGCPELRVAAGLASCASLPGTSSDKIPARSMRQILLPINPKTGSRDWTKEWRDSPIVPGYGLRPLLSVLADVLAWRARTWTAEEQHHQAESPGQAEAVRGVLTFRRGVTVPAADLHDLAAGRLDTTALELWLSALLALDWRRATRTPWQEYGQAPTPLLIPDPALGLLAPLAAGQVPPPASSREQDPGQGERRGLDPDWAARLIAGQAGAVHAEAAARLRQLGWDAPHPPGTDQRDQAHGQRIAAALVPRCAGTGRVLRQLAVSLHPSREAGNPAGAEDSTGSSETYHQHEEM
jgi:CRISPR-associated protein Csx17